MNGGVYEPLAVPIARSYRFTTLSKGARYTQRGLFEATAGECDKLETTSYQHRINGNCIDEDNYK
ncbi:unnamed protein product [Penicillium camemberti]|uniref:Str. FM013 n=1 Tax=Penicillium camemberti (strain FM 013) TaxID=1429867 RepID=A0A0G4PWU8_PENC3|nr:unnamed protein product [Penicillium camemberti]